MNQNISVFCSSSEKIDSVYTNTARELGRRIGLEKDNLVYGGARIGLMGQVATEARKNGAKVIGIIPQKIHDFGVGWQDIDEYIVTKDMHQRKALIEDRADIFVAISGGFGTLEELLEVITLKQLGYHHKAIVLLNTNHFYDPLLAHFESLYKQGFARENYRSLYHLATNVDDIYTYLSTYSEKNFAPKWH